MLKFLISIIVSFCFVNSCVCQNSDEESLYDMLFPIALVDSLPSFIGGNDSLNSWLQSRIEYPKDAVENLIEGKSWARFIIEKDGTLSEIEVYSYNEVFNSEVKAALKSMPKWNPAIENGNKVRCRFQIPIEFKVDNDNKIKRK